MTSEEIATDIKFVQDQIAGLAPSIRQHTILLKAYDAGGDGVKEMRDKVAAALGGQIAMKESLESDLESLQKQLDALV
jgi:hypothetical protein